VTPSDRLRHARARERVAVDMLRRARADADAVLDALERGREVDDLLALDELRQRAHALAAAVRERRAARDAWVDAMTGER
jgi:hypothetical protein